MQMMESLAGSLEIQPKGGIFGFVTKMKAK